MGATDLVIRFAGEAGDGIMVLGDMFVKSCVRSGMGALTFRSYPTEVRGGNVMYQARIGSNEVLNHGDRLDVLVAFNRQDVEKHANDLAEGGTLILDSEAGPFPTDPKEVLPVPMRKLSAKFGHGRRNMVVLGLAARYLGVEAGVVRDLIHKRFGKVEEVLRMDLGAFEAGWEYCGAKGWRHPRPVEPVRSIQPRLLISGNEAISLGAIAAGCRFFAGYPITPASEILEYLAEVLPRFDGSVLQVEDEMAALAAVIGASFTGAKAMTATSGPGFSLMGELIGYASMAEIPCVIVDAQRAGPSTGLPTSTEQSDLLLAVHASHGESPRIVLAPATVEECFYLTMEAFNLAEAYQLPVILLSDLTLSHRLEAVPRPDPARVRVMDRATPGQDSKEGYRRYRVTETGVSPMALPGTEGLYAAMGIEHDERGFPSYTPENRVKMMEKRFVKLNHVDTGRFTRTYGDPGAGVGVIGWGSTQGALIEAVDLLSEKGIAVHGLHLSMLSPLPGEAVLKFAQGKGSLICAEINRNGQCARLLGAELGLETKRINKYVGLPFTAREVADRIEEMVSHD